MVLSTHKKITSIIAVALTTVLLFGSTFAWQSLNQEALNYVKGGANPGGRLHDDFHNITLENDPETGKPYTVKTYDKDVYVENFTSAADDGVDIYVRVRLDEYLEWGTGAGTGSGEVTSLVEGSEFSNKNSWTTYIPDAENATDDELAANTALANSKLFRDYWTLSWKNGGSAVYMPTFNRNKDSLLADINGTFEGGYVKYATSEEDGITTKSGYVVLDNDDDDEDELDQTALTDLIEKGTSSEYYVDDISVSVDKLTQSAAESLTAGTSMSVAQWLSETDNGANRDAVEDCWLYDTDGWFYWSAAIKPGTATGKLLDGIQRTGTAIGSDGETWYYGLNVVAQFITADSLGSAEDNEALGSGFYDSTKGEPPTANALTLLKAIGVNVDGESTAAVQSASESTVEVGNEADLRQALLSGKKVTLTENIELSETLTVTQSASVYLNGFAIAPGEDFSGQSLFTVTNGTWLDFNNSGTVQAPTDGYAVTVEDKGILYIWDGTFIGGEGAISVESGEAVIVDGTFRLQNNESGKLLECADKGKITVYGGSFYNFDPANVNGKSMLRSGCVVETSSDRDNTVYTVSDKVQTDVTSADSTATVSDSEDAKSDTAESESTETDTESSITDTNTDETDGNSEDEVQIASYSLRDSLAVSTVSGGISGKAEVPVADESDLESDTIIEENHSSDEAECNDFEAD